MARPRRRSVPATLGALLLTLGGCDYPTELPHWETEWAFAGEDVRVPVSDLLPEGVEVLADGSAFLLEPMEGGVEWRLRDHCTECALLHGLLVPKPAFEVSQGFPLSLPPEIVEVSVVGGWLDFRIRHGLGFDPIRPGAGIHGDLELRIDGGSGSAFVEVGFHGADRGLPSGVLHADSVPLAPGVIGGGAEGAFGLRSPAGDPARIDANARFSLETRLRELRLDRIRVRPGSRNFLFDESIALGEIGDGLLERMEGGRVTIRVENPFAVPFLLDLTLVGGDGSRFDRELRVSGGSGEVALPFTAPEIRSLLASDAVRVQGTGRLENPTGELELRPDQVLELESVVNVRVRAGGAR